MHLGTDNVAAEEFTFAPGAFLSSYPICGLLMLFATLLNFSMGHITGVSPWLTSIEALAFSIMVPLPFIYEFVLAFVLFNPLFRKKKSINVIGTLCKPGTKIVKRLLIISGHHDSAPENTWLRFLGYGFFILLATFFIGYIIILLMSIIQLLGLIKDNCRAGLLKYLAEAVSLLPKINNPTILDVGCGTGVPTIWLSENYGGIITAIDTDEDALDWLKEKIILCVSAFCLCFIINCSSLDAIKLMIIHYFKY